MIRTGTFFVVLVATAVGMTTTVSVVEADLPANAPWSLETIASITGGDVGQHTSIAFSEASGKPYISYYDATHQDLRLIYPSEYGNCGPNNTWYCEAPDTNGDVGQYSSIDYYHNSTTGENKIGIAYADADGDGRLKVAIWSSSDLPSGWTVSAIDSGFLPGISFWVGRYASLKFDSNGEVHIAYRETTNVLAHPGQWVHYAHSVASGGNCGLDSAAGKWQCESVVGSSDSLDMFLSLDLTPADTPAVVYSISASDTVGICVKTGSDWSCMDIEDLAGGAVSLAIDQLGYPHIGYYDNDNGKLRYAKYVGSGGNCGLHDAIYYYQCDEIDTIGVGLSQVGLSVAIDPEGYPIIAYEDASDPLGISVLDIARPAVAHGVLAGNCGPLVVLTRQWQCTTIDDATQGGGGGHLYEADFASVAVDPDGFAAVAYNEFDDYHNEGRLKFAYQENLIFSDDFESGLTTAWSSSVGGP